MLSLTRTHTHTHTRIHSQVEEQSIETTRIMQEIEKFKTKTGTDVTKVNVRERGGERKEEGRGGLWERV